MITITEKARGKIKEMQKDIGEETYLRFGVKSECCNELKYLLNLSMNKTINDEMINYDDFVVLINPADVRYIENTEIDYNDEPFESGFVIRNPHPLVSF
jgi:iron-sulfur cluster assembly accessory protein